VTQVVFSRLFHAPVDDPLGKEMNDVTDLCSFSFFNFQGYPLVRLSVSNAKKVFSDNDDKPWVILS